MSLRVKLVLLVLGLLVLVLGGLGLYLRGSLRAWTLDVVDAELAHRAQELAGDAARRDDDDDHDDDHDDDEQRRRGRAHRERRGREAARGLPYRLETEDGQLVAGDDLGLDPARLPPRGYATVETAGGATLRVLTLPVPGEGLRVRVTAPLSGFAELASRFRTGLGLALLGAVVLGAAGALLVAQVLLAPLRRLSRDVEGIGATSLDRRIDARGLDPDSARLATAFNGVLARLAEAFAAQRAFVARASHALRTPLAAILSQTEVTLRRERTPEAYREALGQVADCARDASRLADGLLALSRADAAGAAERAEPLALDALATVLTRLFAARAAAAGVELAATVEPGLAVSASRTRLREMLDALLDNALRYTPRGGRVELVARAAGERVRLEVRDTGLGIRPEERELVFERFTRGSAAATSGAPGSGLGLALVRALAEAEGASVAVEENPGGGTIVRLELARATG